MSARSTLTPQMAGYEEKFTDSGEVRWLPYLMYFHPPSHTSSTVNTDASGFRYAVQPSGQRLSATDHGDVESVRLLAGSSTVFGIGASSDDWTLASRLMAHDPRPEPWVNFGGRSFNSTQELLLFTLYQHRLPAVTEIVLFSGFNNLGLARQHQSMRGEHGAFFNCQQFFEALGTSGARRGGAVQRLLRGKDVEDAPAATPSIEQQIAEATDLTLRHLRVWRTLADALGARLTFVLQPLAGWVRARGSAEEEALFAELDQLGRFSEVYGEILEPAVCLDYAARIEDGAKRQDVGFVNLSPVLTDRLTPDQWLFVDRIHFTDDGHDFVARTLLDVVG